MQQDRYIDLHMHSTFSDGVLSPAELVGLASKKGLAAVSLTDHDSVDGFSGLSRSAGEAGIDVLPGVEMSCEHNGRDLHVLGYGVNPEDESLLGMLREFRSAREKRGIRIVEKLGELGIELDVNVVLAKAGDGALGRPHIAEALVQGGHAADFAEVFAKYIGEDCPAYVEKYKMKPSDAVAHIHGAGGLAFVAHPGYYLQDEASFDEILDGGFDGIEVYHPHHKGDTTGRLLAIAERRRLLVSGGSDFHGFAGRVNMGDPKVSYELLEKMRERLG